MKKEMTLNLSKLIDEKLSPNQGVLLYLLYFREFDLIKTIFSIREAIAVRNSLLGTKFILSDECTKFTETILSNDAVTKLFDLKSDSINFWEFYNEYPVNFGSRFLRASGPTAQLALKHQKKYLARVKSKKAHDAAINALKVFVNKQKVTGKLQFLPMMETILNNSLWETWDVLAEVAGQEGAEWNSDTI